VNPAVGAGHGVVRLALLEQSIEASIPVDLGDPGIACKVRASMLTSAIA
jgi:hypothetical protein